MSLLKVNEVQNYNGSSLTLTASTVSTSAQLNTGGNISVTGSINVSDDSTTRSNLGLGTMATQNANAVAITGGTINTVQPASGQSLTIKDEDGNTAITVGTDNTAASYLSLNFGSYHGDSGGAGSGTRTGNTLSDYEEGSWTITLHDANSGGNQSAYSTTGTYVKIGNLVTVTLNASVTFTDYSGSPSNLTSTNVLFWSLPFTPSSTKTASGSIVTSSVNFRNGADACINPIIVTSSARGRFKGYSSGDVSAFLRPTDFNGGSIQHLTLSYFVD